MQEENNFVIPQSEETNIKILKSWIIKDYIFEWVNLRFFLFQIASEFYNMWTYKQKQMAICLMLLFLPPNSMTKYINLTIGQLDNIMVMTSMI